MPSELGRAWDELVRAHWKDLWSADARQAGRARAAFRSFLAAVHEELAHHRRAIEEIRGVPSQPPSVAPRKPAPPSPPAVKPTMQPLLLPPKPLSHLHT